MVQLHKIHATLLYCNKDIVFIWPLVIEVSQAMFEGTRPPMLLASLLVSRMFWFHMTVLAYVCLSVFLFAHLLSIL